MFHPLSESIASPSASATLARALTSSDLGAGADPLRAASGDVAPRRVLLVAANPTERFALRRRIPRSGVADELGEAETLAGARALLERESWDAVILDVAPPIGAAIEFISALRPRPVIVLASVEDVHPAMLAVRAGAVEFLVRDAAESYLELLPAALERALRDGAVQAELKRELEQMRRFEEAAIAAHCVAHDFNQMLTGVLGNLRLASLELAESHPAAAHVAEAMASAQRSRDLVERMLAFSRDAGEKRTMVSLLSVVADAVAAVRPTLPPRVDVKMLLDSRCPAIWADPDDLRAGIEALTRDAVARLRDSGGTIELTVTDCVPDDATLARWPQLRRIHRVRCAVRGSGVRRDAGPDAPATIEADAAASADLDRRMARHHGVVTVDRAGLAGTSVALHFPAASLSA